MSFLTICNKKTFFQKKGRGDVIFLVHGWGGSSKSMEKIVKELSKHFLTVVVDLPGFGQSDAPEKNWGIKEYSNCLVKLADNLKLDKFHYVGYSFGGALGIYLTSHYQKYVKTLTLISPSFKRAKSNRKKTTRLIDKALSLLPFQIGFCIKKIVYKIMFPDSELMLYPSLQSNFKRIINTDLSLLLDKILVSTLVFWGDKDKYTPISNSLLLKNKIKNLKMVIFEDQGHFIHKIKGSPISQEIKKFVSQYEH